MWSPLNMTDDPVLKQQGSVHICHTLAHYHLSLLLYNKISGMSPQSFTYTVVERNDNIKIFLLLY